MNTNLAHKGKSALMALIYIFLAILVSLSLLSFFKIDSTESFIVKTGSMAPKIGAGSLIFTHNSEKYAVGDVITYKAPQGNGTTTTHRIIEIYAIGNDVSYRVMGDANKTADPFLVPKKDVVGKVIFSIPLAGYLLNSIKSPLGFMILVIFPTSYIVIQEIGKIINELKIINKPKSSH